MKTIIASLEQQHMAISRALDALREIGGLGASAAAHSAASADAPRRRGMSPEGKRRLIAALKRRWAEKRKADKAAKKA